MDKNYDKLTKAELIQIIEQFDEGSAERVEGLTKQLKEAIHAAKVEQSEKNALKKELLDLQQDIKEVQATKEARDEAIKREYELRKDRDRLQKEKDDREKLNQSIIKTWEGKFNFVQSRFNDLAVLFDEYMTAFKDQAKLNEVIVRNNKNTLELLESKIMRFNSSVPDTTEEEKIKGE